MGEAFPPHQDQDSPSDSLGRRGGRPPPANAPVRQWEGSEPFPRPVAGQGPCRSKASVEHSMCSRVTDLLSNPRSTTYACQLHVVRRRGPYNCWARFRAYSGRHHTPVRLSTDRSSEGGREPNVDQDGTIASRSLSTGYYDYTAHVVVGGGRGMQK